MKDSTHTASNICWLNFLLFCHGANSWGWARVFMDDLPQDRRLFPEPRDLISSLTHVWRNWKRYFRVYATLSSRLFQLNVSSQVMLLKKSPSIGGSQKCKAVRCPTQDPCMIPYRFTGGNTAAKMMHGHQFKSWMMNEFEMMNVLHHPRLIRLLKSMISRDQMTLITELTATGGELLDVVHIWEIYHKKLKLPELSNRYLKELNTCTVRAGHLSYTLWTLLFHFALEDPEKKKTRSVTSLLPGEYMV